MQGTLVGHSSNPLKRIKLKHEHPIAFGVLRMSKGKKKRDVRILFDSGGKAALWAKSMLVNYAWRIHLLQSGRQATAILKTKKKVKTHFILSELYPERIIEHTFHLLPTTTGYDMIISTDLMSELGLKLNFQDACVEWENASMPFKDRDLSLIHISEPTRPY